MGSLAKWVVFDHPRERVLFAQGIYSVSRSAPIGRGILSFERVAPLRAIGRGALAHNVKGRRIAAP